MHRLARLASTLLVLLVLFSSPLPAQTVSPMSDPPKWDELEKYQETITHDEFAALLDQVYAPEKAASETIAVFPDRAEIRRQGTKADSPLFVLRFAADPARARPVPRWWRPASALPPAPPGRPLDGVRVALDPGHLGGDFARMEERWFQVGSGKPVTEGDMTLLVARHLAPLLEALGATVLPVRSRPGPLTELRPGSPEIQSVARRALEEKGVRLPPPPVNPASESGKALRAESEILFYRHGEITARARRVNDDLRPDIVLCLHFNAEAWGEPLKPTLVPVHHLHLILNGNYDPSELAFDDQRYEMLLKLLGRTHDEEQAACAVLSARMATATGLPPYVYPKTNARPVPGQPYLWNRNLRANRQFQCPVLYLEPYVMNSDPDYARIQLGDYEGERDIAGTPRQSIFREYANAVAAGLADYYAAARK